MENVGNDMTSSKSNSGISTFAALFSASLPARFSYDMNEVSVGEGEVGHSASSLSGFVPSLREVSKDMNELSVGVGEVGATNESSE
eukprot:CAMPEP_0204641298 /NCGR_PEP_ID=MMETSP0717-20131115/50825_1 /ASSEMBLY_ACC=CAM_ASM_000666 /TAXON_ID=230516 /ORGANISM="Chaetoceros curvisetus" /LENGTH=85 /DNA_ID=CAMNT_0051661949 /DNA_START=127 /DNA_END=381 /DNA_ORIENTATION=+